MRSAPPWFIHVIFWVIIANGKWRIFNINNCCSSEIIPPKYNVSVVDFQIDNLVSMYMCLWLRRNTVSLLGAKVRPARKQKYRIYSRKFYRRYILVLLMRKSKKITPRNYKGYNCKEQVTRLGQEDQNRVKSLNSGGLADTAHNIVHGSVLFSWHCSLWAERTQSEKPLTALTSLRGHYEANPAILQKRKARWNCCWKEQLLV